MLSRLAASGLVALALASVGCGSSPPPVAAPSAPCASANDASLAKMSNEELARKLLAVLGADQLGKQVADSMLDTFRKMPNLPPNFIERFKQNMRIEDLNEMVLRIYLKHLDRAVMTSAINYYESEQGHRLVAALPVLTAEAMEAGKAWGGELAKKTLKELGMSAP